MDGAAVVRVLGPIQVERDGHTIELPSASQRRLLAVIAVHAPRAVRVEWLCDVLDLNAGAVRTTVARVRRIAGDDVVLTTATGYRLGVPVDAELAAAELGRAAGDPDAIAPALARWAGRAFDEFAAEEWAAGEAHRLDELHAGGIEDLADALIAQGRPDEAIAAIRPHLVAHPFRDRPRGLSMRAHAATGRRTEALREYQAYRTFLLEAVGTEPSAELRTVERRIAAGWDGGAARPDDPADAPITLSTAVSTERPRVALPATVALAAAPVGRDRELARMADALTSTGPRVVIVSGEAGIGKTTLIAAFARDRAAAAGRLVFYERCDEYVREPYQPVRGLLAQLVDSLPDEALAAHAASWGADVFRLVPQMRSRISVAARDVLGEQSSARYLLFEAVTDLVRRAAERAPMVLILDDLHWADPTALHLLRHLVRSLIGAPVVFVAGYRDTGDASGDQLRSAVSDVSRGGAVRLDLSGLGIDDLDALVRARTTVPVGSDVGSVAAALAAETAGNPLFAEHLLQHWAASASLAIVGDVVSVSAVPLDVPSTLRDLVWHRVDALGPTAEPILTAAAVLGVEFEDRLLARVAGLPAGDVSEALDRASTAGVLADGVPGSGVSRFSHALVARTLETDLGARRRVQLHDRAFEALLAETASAVARRSARLAHHAEQAGRRADAQGWATAAGDEALADLAPEEAARWYRRALDHTDADLTDRADLLVRLGEAQYHAGDPAAFDTLEEGAAVARRCGSDTAVVRAALALDRGSIVRFGAFAARQLAIAEAAVEAVAHADDATRARVVAMLAQSLVHTDQPDRRAAAAHEALDLARRCGDPTLMARVAPDLLTALWAPGTAALRSAVAEEALDAIEGSGDPDLAAAVYKAAHTAAVCAADAAQAQRCLDGLRSLVEDIHEPHLRWTVGMLEVFVAMMEARFDDAQRLVDAAFELGDQIGEPGAWSVFAGQSFALGTFAGRHAELFPLVQHVMETQESVELPFRIGHALVSVEVGQFDAPRALLREGMARGMSAIPGDLLRSTTLLGYAILALELEDLEAAAALLPEVLPMVDEVSFNGATSQGPIAAYVGKLESLLGHHQEAERHLLRAKEIAESFGWRYHLATTELALAQNRCRAVGRLDDDADRWLTSADDLCAAHGIANWSARAAALRSATAR